jgi:hypothetical protein
MCASGVDHNSPPQPFSGKENPDHHTAAGIFFIKRGSVLWKIGRRTLSPDLIHDGEHALLAHSVLIREVITPALDEDLPVEPPHNTHVPAELTFPKRLLTCG